MALAVVKQPNAAAGGAEPLKQRRGLRVQMICDRRVIAFAGIDEQRGNGVARTRRTELRIEASKTEARRPFRAPRECVSSVVRRYTALRRRRDPRRARSSKAEASKMSDNNVNRCIFERMRAEQPRTT